MKIKVGFCVAYDWYYLERSLPPVYEFADQICLSIDKDRMSWSGQPFSFDEAGFEALVQRIDTKKKISILQEKFYIPELSPMANEVRQRQVMASFMGESDSWHVQLDTDEYFLDFGGFVKFLRSFRSSRKVNISCPWINLYKIIPEGILWIKPETFSQIQFVPVATQYPHYEHGRLNGYFNILTPFPILHQSWARDEREILEKLQNWGHSRDFDVAHHFDAWNTVNANTYGEYRNFHYLYPASWPALALKRAVHLDPAALSLEDFPLPITQGDLKKANSIWLSRWRKLRKMLTR